MISNWFKVLILLGLLFDEELKGLLGWERNSCFYFLVEFGVLIEKRSKVELF